MAAKAKPLSRPVVLSTKGKTQTTSTSTMPLTLEERLHRIEAMGQRIDSYIKFMCQIGSLTGSSAEAKERAVATFYEQLVIVEGQLGLIHDNFQLE
jgi:hypothetical protein